MTTAEACRQYQIALEHRRHLRNVTEGILTAELDRAEADIELAEQRTILSKSWVEELYSK